MSEIEKQNVAFIKEHLAQDVMYSFGYDPEVKSPKDGFIKHFALSDRKKTEFWKDLRQAIELGCTKNESSFTCPYVYSKWPDNYDSSSFVAVTKKNAQIRSQPSQSSSVVKSVDFEILKLTPRQLTAWYEIDFGKGKKGYLARSDGRLATDYRVEFSKTNVGWTIKYFIAGD